MSLRPHHFAAGTMVDPNRTRDEIDQVLSRYGAEMVWIAERMPGRGTGGWVRVAFELGGKQYVLPVDFPTGLSPSKLEQERCRRWRALLLFTKAACEMIDMIGDAPLRGFLVTNDGQKLLGGEK